MSSSLKFIRDFSTTTTKPQDQQPKGDIAQSSQPMIEATLSRISEEEDIEFKKFSSKCQDKVRSAEKGNLMISEDPSSL